MLTRILETLPHHWNLQQLYLGVNWTLSIIQNQMGQWQAGLAATPAAEIVAAQSRYRLGLQQPPVSDAIELARNVLASDPVEVTVGLATLNAFLQPAPALLVDIDAADWLLEHGRGRRVALVGRFPFIEELQPVVAQLWVLELRPRAGEYGSDEAGSIIPQADVVAITSSTLINHTLEDLLALTQPEARVMLLGPSTPLTPLLFDFGIDLLSGVQVVEIETVLSSVADGVNFRKMKGVRRVSMQREYR